MRKICVIIFILFSISAKSQTWNVLNPDFDTTIVDAYYYDSTTNELYLGGVFQYFNGTFANGIVKWDGQQWMALGGGFYNSSGTYLLASITSITKYNGEIVAAGLFDSSGTTKFKMPIARWNGSQWLPFDTITEAYHPIGGTLRPIIRNIIVFNGKLFIIGEIQALDPFPGNNNWFNYFAYWNDTIWQPGVRPANNFIYSYHAEFEIYNSDLYISFSDGIDSCYISGQPGVPADGLLKYNYPCRSIEEIGTWGNTERVMTMLAHNGSLYLGLDHFNPSYGSYITRYDGTDFFPLGAGLNWNVESLTIYQGQLVAAGRFLSDGTGVPFLPRIAVWDGANWNPFPASCALDSWIYKVYGHDSLLFASGVFDTCGTSPLKYSAVYPVILTGIHKPAESTRQEVIIYPNPFADKLNISVAANELSELIVYDITSRRILNQRFRNTVSLNTSFLPDGIYIYEVRNKSKSYRGKIVKQ
ncbi:MAG TPA: T9SS type A sorting domain-containing protein [Bacteroidia bacterium]|nr:T9SS type A sorting domain-containing protein [Bacteroidia bacterium]